MICKIKRGHSALLAGNTSQSLYKNVLKELEVIDEGIGWLEKSEYGYRTRSGADIFCVGVNNEGAERRLKGGSIDFLYGDELTTWPRSAYEMSRSRCRGVDINGNLKMMPSLFTTNPDDPMHYVKTELIDGRDENTDYYRFDFSDNPTITQEFIDELSKSFTGVFYRRMILGEWYGDKERLVIPEWGDKEDLLVREIPRPECYEWSGALDPGAKDGTGYVIGHYDFMRGHYVVTGCALDRGLTTDVYAEMIRELEVAKYGNKKPQHRVSDTNLQMIIDFRRLHDIHFMAAHKTDKEANINYVRYLISQERLYIDPSCKDLIRQLRTATWNTGRTSYERNNVDGHYDLLDALVYWCRHADNKNNPYVYYEDPTIKRSTHYYVPQKPISENVRNISSIFGG